LSLSTHHLILKFSLDFIEIITPKHKTFKTNLKLDAFFKPISGPKPVSPLPGTSPANGASLSPGQTIIKEEEQRNSLSE
jgi:hypothetical protein